MLKKLFKKNSKFEIYEDIDYKQKKKEMDIKMKLLCSKFGLEDTPENREKAMRKMLDYQRDKYVAKEIDKKTAIYSALLGIFI